MGFWWSRGSRWSRCSRCSGCSRCFPFSSLTPSDQRGELEALGGDGAVEAVTEVEGGVGQHDVGAAQDTRSLVRFLRGGVQDRPVTLRGHSLFLKTIM